MRTVQSVIRKWSIAMTLTNILELHVCSGTVRAIDPSCFLLLPKNESDSFCVCCMLLSVVGHVKKFLGVSIGH